MPIRGHRLALVLVLLCAAAGCGPRAPREGGAPARAALEVGTDVPVSVLADSAEAGGLPPARGPAAGAAPRVTLVRVALERGDVAPPLPLPEASAPEGAGPAREGLAADDVLRPPLPRGPLELRVAAGPPATVELDVRVDEHGAVTDVRPAGGDVGEAALAAAAAAARRSRWYPATLHGRPVAVWCRQRFATGAR